MPAMLGLPDALRRRGLKVEVVPGWETRSAGSFNPKGAVAHWTAGPRNATGRPSLNICINGRPGLDGPLCNVYGARDGTAVVVAAGRANHAGAGSWRGLVGNSAVFGTEMEGADARDFTAAQRWAYPRINAAYCDLGGFGADMICGHSEWAGPRKTDINGYTMADLRREVAAILTGTQEDDLMSALDEPITKPDGKVTTLRQVLAWSDANIDETRRIVREEIATRVLETPVPNEWRRGHGEPYESPDPKATTTLGAQIAWMDAQTVETLNRIAEVNEKVDALAATLKAIAAKLSAS